MNILKFLRKAEGQGGPCRPTTFAQVQELMRQDRGNSRRKAFTAFLQEARTSPADRECWFALDFSSLRAEMGSYFDPHENLDLAVEMNLAKSKEILGQEYPKFEEGRDCLRRAVGIISTFNTTETMREIVIAFARHADAKQRIISPGFGYSAAKKLALGRQKPGFTLEECIDWRSHILSSLKLELKEFNSLRELQNRINDFTHV